MNSKDARDALDFAMSEEESYCYDFQQGTFKDIPLKVFNKLMDEKDERLKREHQEAIKRIEAGFGNLRQVIFQ